MTNPHFWNPQDFFKDELSGFLIGYYRNRQQSQRNHIEIIAEKLTVKTILEKVAAHYSIPLTINRGMSGPTVKKKIVDRFRRSKRECLIVLVVSDLDPAADAIAQDIRDAFQRDFYISEVEVYKVALTMDQADEMGLEPSMKAKESSPTFVKKHDMTDAYELEALEPAELQRILIEGIESAMDTAAYHAEVALQKSDAEEIRKTRAAVINFLATPTEPSVKPLSEAADECRIEIENGEA